MTQALVTQVMTATKSSNKLPQEGDDFDYYMSFPGFQTFSSKMAKRVDRIISKIVRHQQLPCYWGVEEESGVPESSQLEEKFETLIEANDILLERAVSLSWGSFWASIIAAMD
jgi:exosome complex exonuclease RRP6